MRMGSLASLSRDHFIRSNLGQRKYATIFHITGTFGRIPGCNGP